MRKIFYLIGLFLFIGGISLANMAPLSAYDFYSDSTNTAPAYCSGDSCTLSGSVSVAKEVTGGVVDSGSKPLSEYIMDIAGQFLQYTTLIAVLFVLYAGFRIMTSNGDENTVKTGRRTIIFVLVGILVMWLAYAIVNLVMDALDDSRSKTASNTQFFAWDLIPQTHAQETGIYSESEKGTFNEYKSKIYSQLEDIADELAIYKQVNTSTLNDLKDLIESAHKRLPDKNPSDMEVNKRNKKYAFQKIEIAKQDTNSSTKINAAIAATTDFLNAAKIEQITGSVEATPTSGNAPLTVSFNTDSVVDPTGTSPNDNNYIWWMRNASGVRKDLGRGPSFMHQFDDEGSYTVFLDIKSSSKNTSGFTDVLPITLSKQIEVKPKLGEIVLLINGIDVSNKETLKITPEVASNGLIFDATASRAISNGAIQETTWDFGNGNADTYKGRPGVERQAYTVEGQYTVSLKFTSNNGKTFQKNIQLVIQNPAATIQVQSNQVLVGKEVDFSLDSFYGPSVQNVSYSWVIQGEDMKKVTKMGENISYAFDTPGDYIVTLRAKNPNGDIDQDSISISVESRDPIVNIDAPKSIDTGHPNTLVFDGSKSFDPDLNSREGLSYTWRIDGVEKELENTSMNGAVGTLTFDQLGSHNVSLTVTNKYGKVAVSEKDFTVDSLLAVEMEINPEVAQINKTVHFAAHSENADFFEWNFGDGSDEINSDDATVEHIYGKTGIYTVRLTVRTADSDEKNTISRRVYITDTDTPFALITASNSSNSIIEEPNLCQGEEAFTVNRSEVTNFDAGKSIDIDGNTGNLEYTWRYMGRISTSERISETFGDLGCYPLSLTVRSKKNGATATTTKYMYLRNQAPQLTSITTQVDEKTKDSQKIIVRVSANGVKDPDGVVTAYTWYYKTETDPEPQSLQITQNPEITFILPNITEKYYFGVILQDNDNARVNSENILQSQAPLIVDNANGNVYLPLISLNPSKTAAKVNESIRFSATASTILGTNITSKSKYAWDFDGDGRIDETTQEPYTDYAYKKVGTYNMKVRATYNGVSNVKYQTITVRNPLKASFVAYRLENALYLINTSQGAFDKAYWEFGEYKADSLYSALVPYENIPLTNEDGSVGKLSVSYNDSEIDTAKIYIKDAIYISESENGAYQSSIVADGDTIHISDPSQGLGFSFYGNKGFTNFGIDTDASIDSDLDGNTENDIDNKGHASYENGSFYRIADFESETKRERKIKLFFIENDQVKTIKEVTLVFDFITDVPTESVELEQFGENTLTDFEKEKIDTLATLIREIKDDSERIIIMKKYNILVENWDSSFEKAKYLIDIQELVVDADITSQQKTNISKVIDELLVGNAESVNNITVAAQLIKDLVPADNANREKILQNLDTILNQADKYEENKNLAKEILELIQYDDTIESKYKEYIKSQLLIIINNGDAKKAAEQTTPIQELSDADSGDSGASGIIGFFMNIIKIFLFILLIILLIVLGAYVFFRLTRKNSKLAFQDFMIDSVFHGGRAKKAAETPKKAETVEIKKDTTLINVEAKKDPVKDPLAANTPKSTNTDPLTSFEAPKKAVPLTPETPTEATPTAQEADMPDWLKPATASTPTPSTPTPEKTPDPLASTQTPDQTQNTQTQTLETTVEPPTLPEQTTQSADTSAEMPDWLKGASTETTTTQTETITKTTTSSQTEAFAPLDTPAPAKVSESTDTKEETLQTEEGLPDWLKGASTETTNESKNSQETIEKQEDTSLQEPTQEGVSEPLLESTEKEEANTSGDTEISTDNARVITETQESSISNEDKKSETLDTDEENTTEITPQDTDNEVLPDWLVESSDDEAIDTSIPDWLVEAAEEDTKEDEEKKKDTLEEKSEETPKNTDIEIQEMGTLENMPESNLVDTAVTSDSIKIIEDDSIVNIVKEKEEEEKKAEENTKTPKKKSTRRRKTTQKKTTQTKKTTTKKESENTTKKPSSKKKTSTTHKKPAAPDTTKKTTDIPDWLQ